MPSLSWSYSTVRLVHSIIAYLLMPYTVLHIVLQWFFGRFWTIFKAQLYRPHVLAGLLGVAIAVPVALGLFAGNEVAETLMAPRLTADMPTPVLDGKPTDPAWDQVEAVTLRTVKGMNNPHDYVDLHVKALHDGEQIYFQFQWDDPDVSGKRFPLLKTPDGWQVLQTAMEYADENVYYKDKLSVYFTDVTNGSCATTCHVGSGPHAERGEKHGLHYTAGEVGDVWHWKYVRTNFMHHEAPGYMDDQHFKAPEPLPTEITTRYSGGYHPDPKTGGGYTYNFVKLDPAKPLAETYVQPKMLPPTRNIRPHVDPATSDQEATWWIHQSEGIPYTAEADTYPVGTLIPNILIAPFEGDRADVRAKGAWHNGRWTLKARRALDTGNAYDVAFTTDRPIYLSIAAYNRTQTRHSEHIKPIKLVLEK